MTEEPPFSLEKSELSEKSVYSLKAKFSRPRAVFFVTLLFFIFYFVFLRIPNQFPAGAIISVEEGLTLSQVSELLEEKSVVNSAMFFTLFFKFFTGGEKVISGDYFFNSPRTVFSIANRLTKGNYGLKAVKAIIPEGTSIAEMGLTLEKLFPEFNRERFLSLASEEEGYLFPDTYLFPSNVKEEQVVSDLRKNFDKKISTISGDVIRFGKNLKDVITMASLLEEEARTTDTRRKISGILWKRLEAGMPLQVDATFLYINGKNTFQLTTEDLSIDSPYNTYKYRGLPPGPITNPGLDSILAAINPVETPYFFYLSDSEGVMHYAETHEGHVANRIRSLKK